VRDAGVLALVAGQDEDVAHVLWANAKAGGVLSDVVDREFVRVRADADSAELAVSPPAAGAANAAPAMIRATAEAMIRGRLDTVTDLPLRGIGATTEVMSLDVTPVDIQRPIL
jgi:hypothetical protein